MDTLTVKEMTMTKEKLFKQVGDEVMEYTEADYAQAEIDSKAAADKAAADKAAADKAAAAKAALLAKLGITADEARLLLGGN